MGDDSRETSSSRQNTQRNSKSRGSVIETCSSSNRQNPSMEGRGGGCKAPPQPRNYLQSVPTAIK